MKQHYGPVEAANAAALSERTRYLTGRVVRAPRISFRRPGAFALLLLGLWMLIGPFALRYPYTVVGQDSELRDAGFAVVIMLSAMFLLGAESRVPSAVTGLCGVLLVLAGLLMPHAQHSATVNEIVTGFLVILASAATLDAADPPARPADGGPLPPA